MRAALRELLFTEDKLYPPRLGNLAAWYDSLDPVTMLAGNGQQVTDGGTVCLWKDKSGNSGVNCLVLPGVNGNYASVIDDAALNPAGDFAGYVEIRPSDGTPAAQMELFNHSGLAGQRGVYFSYLTTGAANVVVSYDGTALLSFTTTATSIFSDFEKKYIGFEVDVDNGAGGTNCTFYTSPDAMTWTPVEAAKTVAGTGVLFNTNTIFSTGSTFLGTNPFGGNFYKMAWLNGTLAAGTPMLAIDFTTAPTKLANLDTFVCTTGQTVTLNSSGATGARIAGERDLYQGTAANRPVLLKYAGTKYGWLNGTAGNYFSTTALTAFGTGDFSVSAKVNLSNLTFAVLFGSGNNGFLLSYTASYIQTAKRAVANNTPATNGCISALTELVVGYTRSGTTGTYYVNGVEINQITDAQDYTSGLTTLGATDGGGSPSAGILRWARIYNAALDATAMAADAAGTVQAGIVAHFNPALYTSGTTFTASTGEVWTVNGGAHIVTRTGLYFDGSNDYLKSAAFSYSQPESVYGVLSQITWTQGEPIYDGNSASESMKLGQGYAAAGSVSPALALYAGTDSAENASGLPIKTSGVVTGVFDGAGSLLRINRGTSATGSVGTQSANGLSVGARVSSGTYGNIFVSELILRSAADNTATQDRFALYAGRRHSFSA